MTESGNGRRGTREAEEILGESLRQEICREDETRRVHGTSAQVTSPGQSVGWDKWVVFSYDLVRRAEQYGQGICKYIESGSYFWEHEAGRKNQTQPLQCLYSAL